MVEAADLFNESAFRRTISGIAKSLGQPNASIVPLSGTNSEVVLTVAWDISWYQYRITPDSGQPVRLAERGHDPRELETLFTGWNARLTEDGRITPEISPRSSASPGRTYNPSTMIYCVIPRELEDELYDKMVEYYKDNPHVTVIVDRREGDDRRSGPGVRRQARDPRPPQGSRAGDVPQHRPA